MMSENDFGFAVDQWAACKGKAGITEKYLFTQCDTGKNGPIKSLRDRDTLLAVLLPVLGWAAILISMLCRSNA